MSAVDGADPFGLNPLYSITPGVKVNYTIPTLQQVAGLDPVPSGPFISCIKFIEWFLKIKLCDYYSFGSGLRSRKIIRASLFQRHDRTNLVRQQHGLRPR